MFKGCKARIKGEQIEWDERFALGVVMASKGYPEKYETGFPILGIRKRMKLQRYFIVEQRKKEKRFFQMAVGSLCYWIRK